MSPRPRHAWLRPNATSMPLETQAMCLDRREVERASNAKVPSRARGRGREYRRSEVIGERLERPGHHAPRRGEIGAWRLVHLASDLDHDPGIVANKPSRNCDGSGGARWFGTIKPIACAEFDDLDRVIAAGGDAQIRNRVRSPIAPPGNAVSGRGVPARSSIAISSRVDNRSVRCPR